MVRRWGILAGAFVLAWSSGCASVFPYLSSEEVDLDKSRVVTLGPAKFDTTNWICVIFDREDFVRLTRTELDELAKVRYSVRPAGGLRLFPFDEQTRRGTDLPPRTEYLFEVAGQGTAQVTIDFSNVNLSVHRFRIAALKNAAQLKDPRVRWNAESTAR